MESPCSGKKPVVPPQLPSGDRRNWDAAGDALRGALTHAKLVSIDPETGSLHPRKLRSVMAAVRPKSTLRRFATGALRAVNSARNQPDERPTGHR